MNTKAHKRGSRRGFSLIEVLLAVLVLGLGMLGLAAVFPVVISQQRDAIDNVAGVAASSTVEDLIDTTSALDGLKTILRDPNFGRDGSTPVSDADEAWVQGADFLWSPTWTWNGHDASADILGEATISAGLGNVLIWDNTTGGDSNSDGIPDGGFISYAPGLPQHPGVTEIPVASRLVPAPYSGAAPQFVWDAVPRRTPENKLQVAIFVRRIDTGIRVPQDLTLADVVSQQRPGFVPNNDVRLPVGMSSRDAGPSGKGAPLNSSGGNDPIYAAPIVMHAEVYNDPAIADDVETFDRLELSAPDSLPGGLAYSTASDSLAVRAALREGQQLVDNLGIVRTVLGQDEQASSGSDIVVRVRPSFTKPQANVFTGAGPVAGSPEFYSAVVQQVVYTTKPPVRVIVRTIGQ